MATPDLKRLRFLVDQAIGAAKEAQAGPRIRVAQEFFTEDTWKLAWEAVRYVRERHHDLYGSYLHESTIAGLILDQFLATSAMPTLRDIIAELRRRADEEGEWLIEVPLTNALSPRETVA